MLYLLLKERSKKVFSFIFSNLLFLPMIMVPMTGCNKTAVKVTKNDVLSIRDGRFYLEGKPFVEISFNKFDLFWAIWNDAYAGNTINSDNAIVKAQDEALRELHELGFKTIRFFALPYMHADFRNVYEDPVKRETIFYKTMDLVMDLCDKNDIKVVYSLCCASFTDQKMTAGKWDYGTEHARELIGNPQSESRKRLYEYLDDIVARYKDRKTILMWEISNEVTNSADISPPDSIYNGERKPSMSDVANFFDNVAKRIKLIDKLRLVNNGGSHLRESAWNLYNKKSWKLDTPDQHFSIFQMLYEKTAIDVIDVHYYNIWNGGYIIAGSDNKGSYAMNLLAYKDFAQRIGKPLYIGEFGTLPALKDEKNKIWQSRSDYFESFNDSNAKDWVQKAVDEIIEAEIPFVHWWCYQSDRAQDQKAIDRMDIDIQRNPEIVNIIVDANKRLKEKLGAD